MTSPTRQTLVGIIMGSKSDWPDTMAHAAETLDALGVPYETRVVSAHRTPDLVFEYASTADSRGIVVEYYRHDGILPYVLRQLASK